MEAAGMQASGAAQRLSSARRLAAALGFLLGLGALGAARAADLSSSAQANVRAATFEVVQLKPPDGPITYERPLPLELIPYAERVDKYRSIGTAFAIGTNRFVTAAHVIVVGAGSQYGPPALRDASGQVYDIDQILKYSERQDFVVFSLKRLPSGVRALKTAEPPALNDTVFAVGNALGQGVVIRDGVFTSETPEDQEGAWKWLRFTAAASPGNSGGPLVDDRGRVIGVVLRKSPNENLNYAAPIKLVSDASEKAAVIEDRSNFHLAFMDASEIVDTHEQFPLPKSFADFYAAYLPIRASMIEHGDRQILEHNHDRLFPYGASSAELLTQTPRSPFPRRITEGSDGVWGIAAPKTQRAQLDHNGFVEIGGGMIRLHAPDDTTLATLYGDSKLFMDLVLKSGFGPRRNVGGDQIKVTSLGKAEEDIPYRDSYGRLWKIMIWPVPFADSDVITFNMPTPEGYVSLFGIAPSTLKDLIVLQQKLYANYIWLTFEATLARWREYLALKDDQPSALANVSVQIAPDFTDVHVRTKRCEIAVGPRQEALTKDSILSLAFSFFKDGERVVWDVGGLAFGESTQKDNWLIIQRTPKPDAALPEKLQSDWTKMSTGQFPFNGEAVDDRGGMGATMVASTSAAGEGQAPAADQMKVRYVLRVQAEGSPGQEAVHARLVALDKAFKAYEH
jgi:serine protease Do